MAAQPARSASPTAKPPAAPVPARRGARRPRRTPTSPGNLAPTDAAPPPVPRYREIANHLMADIAEGRYALGALLPPELELCREHGISRFTAREALRQLAEAGLVSRRQGSGTVVINRPGESRFTQQVDNIDGLTQYARTTELRLFYTGTAELNRMQARLFKAEPGARWWFASGVRFDRPGAKAQPLCVTRLYLNPALPDIREPLRLRDGPVYEVIERECGVKITRVEQQISAVSLDRDDAANLDEATGRPALRTMRFYYDESQRLLEVSENVHPGDRFAYSMELERKT
jgi:DNA-binding GntR family transcriptional regulator